MPLADTEGGIALGVKDFGDRRCRVRDVPQLMGKPVRQFDTPRIPTACCERPVNSAASRGEHSGVTWKIRELHAGFSQRADVGRVDVGAVATELGETGVVHQDDDNRASSPGCTGSVKCGSESARVRPILPSNPFISQPPSRFVGIRVEFAQRASAEHGPGGVEMAGHLPTRCGGDRRRKRGVADVHDMRAAGSERARIDGRRTGRASDSST